MGQRSENEIQQEVRQRMLQIELLRQETQGRGLKFTSLSEEELRRKASGESAQSPYIFGQSWTSSTTPGSPAIYSVSVGKSRPVWLLPDICYHLLSGWQTSLAISA